MLRYEPALGNGKLLFRKNITYSSAIVLGGT